MAKQANSMTISKASSMIHKNHPEIKVKDAKAVLEAYADLVEYAMDVGEEVKLSDVFKLYPEWQKPRKQYNGANSIYGGKGETINLPKRKLIKLKPLKRLQKVQRDSWKE